MSDNDLKAAQHYLPLGLSTTGIYQEIQVNKQGAVITDFGRINFFLLVVLLILEMVKL